MINAIAIGVAPLLAAANNAGGEIPIFQHFVVDGGWVTWFVLIPLSFIGLALAVHYALTIRRSALLPPKLIKELEVTLRAGNAAGATAASRAEGGMLGTVIYAGLSKLGEGAEAVRAALDDAIDGQTARLMRRVEMLNIIGNVSPMVGLFGTVVGMIRAFNRMSGMEGGMANASNAAKLSGDISIAFVNTFWGLLIAVPALTIFAMFRSRVEAISEECNTEAERLINTLASERAAH